MTIAPVLHDPAADDARGVSAADLLQQIAVFRYCEDVLEERSGSGSRAWLWQVKRKVATYCRATLEGRAADEACPLPAELTEAERRELLRAHPLLCDPSPAGGVEGTCPDWLARLRSRVARYMAHLRESQSGRGAGN